MTAPSRGAIPSAAPDPSPGGRLVFWLLAFMGVGAFAPCVLLPEWRTYQALKVAEQAQQHRLEALQRVVDRENRLLEALRSDPAVINRFAQRDLSFRRPGERAVRVSLPAADDDSVSRLVAGDVGEESFIPEPVLPPRFVARALAHLPDYDYDRVFCDDETRPIIMGMSVALIGVAFGLFGRHRTPSPAEP